METEMEYDPDDPLFRTALEAYGKYFNAEEDFMAAEGYFNTTKARLRKKAVSLIAQHSKCEKFDAFIPYLAMNYFDRYLSRHELPDMRQTLKEDLALCAICCLTLAWKMRKKSFSVTKFLRDQDLNIDRRLIMKMELFILGGLEWRMRALLPLVFVEYFVPFFKLREPLISGGFKRRDINEVIVQVQGDITFTKFRPSIIAASALLFASSVLYPRKFPWFREKIASANVVKKEALLECLEAMDKVCKEKKIVIERPGMESAAASISRAGPSKAREPEGGGGGEAPVVSRREGKAPIEEIEEVPREEENEATLMNFPLDWVNPDAEEDEPISNPIFRELLSRALCGRIRCCNLQ